MRTLLIAMFAVAAISCGSDSTEPRNGIGGLYALESINGVAIPATPDTIKCAMYYKYMTLTFSESVVQIEIDRNNCQSAPYDISASAKVRQRGDSVFIDYGIAPNNTTFPGKLSGSTLDMSFDAFADPQRPNRFHFVRTP